VADPPWLYQKRPGSKQPEGRSGPRTMVERHYSTMTNEEIAALPVKDLAADAAHLYMWFTPVTAFGGRFSKVTPADICEAWGFEFKTVLTWVKTGPLGLGYFFRGNAEFVLFGTRGGPEAGIPADKRESNVFTSPRQAFSQKPACFFDLVERVSTGPYVELFARQPRLGWDHWGLGFETQGGDQ
jgi:N6-adenosine-specific RNA methylase IME4